jgi:hypothetical protein
VKYVFSKTTAEGKTVKSFTSEHFRVSNLINHVTLCIKVTRIILRSLSALLLDEVNIAKRNITTGLFGLVYV